MGRNVLTTVSVFFTKAFTEHLNGFVLLQIIIHASFFIVAIIILSASGHIQSGNKKACENLQNGEYDKPKRGGF